MKIIVISDSHGNIANLKHVMGFAKKIKAGAVIHCGDWDNLKAVNTVLLYKIPIYGVIGNADIDESVKNRFKDFLEFEIGNRKIGVIHSFSNHLISNIELLNILFSGHRHRQREFTQDGMRIVNPGALENEINFAIYDTKTNKVEFIND